MASLQPDFAPVRVGRIGSDLLAGNLLAVCAMVLWSAGFPAAERLLLDWHPLTLMSLRLAMVVAVIVPLWLLTDGVRQVVEAPWGRGIGVGMIGLGAGAVLLIYAQWYTDPITVALISTTTPIAATLIEVAGGTRKLTYMFLVGLAASVFGGMVAIGDVVSVDFGWGVLMAVAAGFFYAWGSNATARDFPHLSVVGRCAITFVGGAIFTWGAFAIAAFQGVVSLPAAISTHQLALLAIYAVAAMVVSQVLFIAAVGRMGIAVASFHINLSPFYVMTMMVALGTAWDPRAAVGCAIVAFGVILSQLRS